MGEYYSAGKVQQLGKEVIPSTLSQQPFIQRGHSLIAVLANVLSKIAMDVTRPSEYQEAYQMYRSGAVYYKMRVYSIPTKWLAECPTIGGEPYIEEGS